MNISDEAVEAAYHALPACMRPGKPLPQRGRGMSEDVSMNITDREYALIRNHLSPSMAAFFDGLKASGARLGDSIDGGSKTPYIIAWHRAVNKAEGLTRYPRIHDLRVTKMRQGKGVGE